MCVTLLAVVLLQAFSYVLFLTCVAFLTAAGYASADVMYDVGDPPFIYQGFTVAPIDVNIPELKITKEHTNKYNDGI